MKRILLSAILVLGVILRLAYAASLPPVGLDSDEQDYVAAARALVGRGSFDETVRYHVPPGTPLLFAAAFSVLGEGYVQVRIVQGFLFAAIGGVIYLLGVELGGRAAGLLALLFAAIYPYFIYFSSQALSETAGVLAVSAMLLMGVRAARDGPWGALGFGVLLAGAALTRAAACYFVLAVPLVFAIAWGVRSLRWVRASAVTLAGFLTLYLPWIAVNYRAYGEWIPTPTIGSGVMLYQTALRLTMPDEAERLEFFRREIRHRYYEPPGASHRDRLAGDRYLQREGRRILVEHLGGYPRVVWENFLRFWQFYPGAPPSGGSRGTVYLLMGLGSFGVLFPFFVYGLWASRRCFRTLSCLYGFLVYFTLVHCLLYGKLRYRIPMDGLVLAFAASGMAQAALRWAPATRARVDAWLAGGQPVARRA